MQHLTPPSLPLITNSLCPLQRHRVLLKSAWRYLPVDGSFCVRCYGDKTLLPLTTGSFLRTAFHGLPDLLLQSLYLKPLCVRNFMALNNASNKCLSVLRLQILQCLQCLGVLRRDWYVYFESRVTCSARTRRLPSVRVTTNSTVM